MTASWDLTRWNRGGLSRFRYVDGNAATLLEDLRLALMIRFLEGAEFDTRRWREPGFWKELRDDPDLRRRFGRTVAQAQSGVQWSDLWVDIPQRPESAAEWQRRLADQYQEVRREWGWEMARSFARAAQVVTETTDAYANEGFLETATQWESLRRLVAMIDYAPAPAASAGTALVLQVKQEEDDDEGGTVEAGLRVKHTPEAGGAPVVFETLEDIDVHRGLNGLHLSGWDRNTSTLDPWQSGANSPWTDLDEAAPAVGETAILVQIADETTHAMLTEVESVDLEAGTLTLNAGIKQGVRLGDGTAEIDNTPRFITAHTLLHIAPQEIRRPRIGGGGSVRLDRDAGLAAGSTVAWKDGEDWILATVRESDGRTVRFEGTPPPKGTSIYRTGALDRPDRGSFYVSGKVEAIAERQADGRYTRYTLGDVTKDDWNTNYELGSSYPDRVYVVPEAPPVLGIVREGVSAPGALVFDGAPGALGAGQWLVLEDEDGNRLPAHIERVDKRESEFTLVPGPAPSSFEKPVARIYGAFAAAVPPREHDVGQERVVGTELVLVDELLDLLTAGRRLVLAPKDADGGGPEPLLLRVVASERASRRITVDPGVPEEEAWLNGRSVLHANVVPAGHGETRPEKILGSGIAGLASQAFLLEETEVSWVPDVTMAAGVRAAVAVTVDGQTYTQVSRLSEAGPDEAAYEVRLTEDGHLRLIFGDGIHGRRLPVGVNNVRVRYRKGTGRSGNLPPGSLSRMFKPHRLLDSVMQPIGSTGGNDAEGRESLRQNAARGLFTLERAVSAEDFARLAASLSTVWQARAFEDRSVAARGARIEVVVVPSGGGALGTLEATLTDYLRNRALPGVTVSVSEWQPIAVDLEIEVAVTTAEFDPLAVIEAVRESLAVELSLERRTLGAPLFRSELYSIVEGVRGVRRSRCLIAEGKLTEAALRRVRRGNDGTVRLVQPTLRQVLFLDPDASAVTITWTEHTS